MSPERIDGISVIIPTLNEALHLPATLKSVFDAFGPSVEVVVVDGGSSDGTSAAVEGRARIVKSPAGRGQQLNTGARIARGAILVFLHADTWLDPANGASLTAALAHPEVVGGCFKLELHGPSSHSLVARSLSVAINARTRWLQTATGDQAIFARRSAFERIGGFPPIDLFEDVIFYRQLRRLGKVAVIGPAVRTSDRRWRHDGYLRTISTHLALRLLFHAGATPERLARFYRPASGR